MDLLAPDDPAAIVPEIPAPRPPRIWKFWGTLLWGLFISAAVIAGQIVLIPAWFVWHWEWPRDLADVVRVASGSLMVPLSVIMGLPAVLAALWIAIRLSATPFTEYLALRGSSWRHFFIGIGGLFGIVVGWGLLSRAVHHEATPDMMGAVLQSARRDGALWLMVLALGVGAPATEELLVRGFLYRGWSESFLRPAGAILLSSLVWAAVHLQYDWFLRGEVFCIGVLLGYLRYRSNSTWLTVVLHGLNNSAGLALTIFLADQA